MGKNNKILVITGPTATGKTALGIEIAKKFNGEIISADSRQVYVGNDVETGKDVDKSKVKIQKSKLQFKNKKISNNYYNLDGTAIWGVDIVEQDDDFNPSDFVDYAQKVIADISSRRKLPIIVGGTGQYIKELISPSETLNIPADQKLRKKLEGLLVEELQNRLQKIDPAKWRTMNISDQNNPRRLIRAIEVATLDTRYQIPDTSKYDTLLVGLTAPKEVLLQKIIARRRDRPDLVNREFALAKKQLVYMKKFLSPVWFDISQPNYPSEIFSTVAKWYTRNHGTKEAQNPD